MMDYFCIKADTPIWRKVSHLKGKEFRVPYKWRKGCLLRYNDWKVLVKKGFAGKWIYVQKNKIIDYKKVLSKNKFLHNVEK